MSDTFSPWHLEEYDRFMQEELDYEDYYETCPEDETRLTFHEWRERRKVGWWGLR